MTTALVIELLAEVGFDVVEVSRDHPPGAPRSADDVADFVAAANTDWLSENPRVEAILREVDLSVDELAELTATLVAANPETWHEQVRESQRIAVDRIAEHRPRVDAWLASAN
jgi:ABC-type proline/glycine betaine transport system substrate-binding protein